MSNRVEIDRNVISQIQQLLPKDTRVSEFIQFLLPPFWSLLQSPLSDRDTQVCLPRPDFWNALTFKVEYFVLEILRARQDKDQVRIAGVIDRFREEILPKTRSLPREDQEAFKILFLHIDTSLQDLGTAQGSPAATTSTTALPDRCDTPFPLLPHKQPDLLSIREDLLSLPAVPPLSLDGDSTIPVVPDDLRELLLSAQIAATNKNAELLGDLIALIVNHDMFRYAVPLFHTQLNKILDEQSRWNKPLQAAAAAPSASVPTPEMKRVSWPMELPFAEEIENFPPLPLGEKAPATPLPYETDEETTEIIERLQQANQKADLVQMSALFKYVEGKETLRESVLRAAQDLYEDVCLYLATALSTGEMK